MGGCAGTGRAGMAEQGPVAHGLLGRARACRGSGQGLAAHELLGRIRPRRGCWTETGCALVAGLGPFPRTRCSTRASLATPPTPAPRPQEQISAVAPRAPVAGRAPRAAPRLLGSRPPHASRPTSALRRGRQGADPRPMGASEGTPRRLGGGRSRCPHCGLPRDRVATLGHEWVMLEPDLRPLAHEVPAGHRWIELSDGRVTVYGVCPPDPFQRCRIEHRLACPNRSLPDLWPWLTDRRSENARRGENARRTERRHAPEPEPPPEEWPDAG
ncbi:DUF6083 domain-containing protein [Streptomyces murinus]|uniref:DUF6083 domain-containing protein n=1 Tax=Streptomyces murinus TaxID=33900 RepID=UPI003F484DBA